MSAYTVTTVVQRGTAMKATLTNGANGKRLLMMLNGWQPLTTGSMRDREQETRGTDRKGLKNGSTISQNIRTQSDWEFLYGYYSNLRKE